MALDGEKLLAALYVAAGAAWLGGLLTVPVLAVASRRLLTPADRAELFVTFGRGFALVMGLFLTLALIAAVGLATSSDDPVAAGALLLTIALLLLTAIGIVQARTMSGLRKRAAAREVGAGDDPAMRRNSAAATALRSVIGLVSLAVVVVGVFLVGRG